MLFEVSQVIEASKKKGLANLAFGLPIADYPDHGQVAMSGAYLSYDYLAISECRRCGNLNTTLAMDGNDVLEPMSAGRGPECRDERCGDKVPVICHAIYEIVEGNGDKLIDSSDLEELAACVEALNEKLDEFAHTYQGRLRIMPSVVFSPNQHATVMVEVASVIASFGQSRRPGDQ